jgi:hypothetical protein
MLVRIQLHEMHVVDFYAGIKMLTDEEMHERMHKGWRAGLPHTVCGNGSLAAHTKNVRGWLPLMVDRYKIATVCDAGAGDLTWMRGMTWDVQYSPFDLIPRHPHIGKCDITTEALPKCDLILCRMVLNHLDETRIVMALNRFRESGVYLAATQFDREDWKQGTSQFRRLDLRKAPYGLGKPLDSIQDGSEEICSLAIWKL